MSLIVKFYDVEHGSCTHIITPNNKHYLIDIGTKSTKSICQHLKNKHLPYGNIDYLVITHPHIDHIADLENLYTYNIKPSTLRRAREAFPLPILSTDTQSQATLKRKANEMDAEYTSPVTVDPCSAINNGGVDISFFDAAVNNAEKSDLNNYSCIMILDYAGFKVVLTGDNPSSKLTAMLQQQNFRQTISNATVLLAPHHGRDSDYCDEFVEAVNPLLTVFSDKAIQHETQAHAAQKYYAHTRGVKWNGSDRYILTTRNDGTITFTFRDNETWGIDVSTTEY